MLDPVKDIFRMTGLPDLALHVLLGIAIYLLAAVVLRRTWSSWLPWIVTFVFQIINEAADAAKDVLMDGAIRWRGSLLDTAATMALPTVILLLSRVSASKTAGERR